MISIERTYNVGAYQSLKVWASYPVDITDLDSVKKAGAYLTLLSDLLYFNYISTSPVMNNNLTKEIMNQLDKTLKNLQLEIKLEVTEEQKGEE